MPPKPTVRVLSELPKCEPNLSTGEAFLAAGKGFVVYETSDSVDGSRVAVLHFPGCLAMDASGPNDEAFAHHRWFSCGLRHYDLQEIVDSPWVYDCVSRRTLGLVPFNRRGLPRHFVLAFKENSIECIADDCHCLGIFPTHAAAIRAVGDAMFGAND